MSWKQREKLGSIQLSMYGGADDDPDRRLGHAQFLLDTPAP
jgi:hypothetical protein